MPAQPWHVEVIADNPRPADVLELQASSGTTPAEAMRAGMARSLYPTTGMLDGMPVCMFGATPYSILGGIGVPWLIGSAAMDSLQARKALLRASRVAFAEMRRQFPALLFNAVDDRNEAAQRWLAWLGFEIGEALPIGRDGEPFRVFYWRKRECAK